MAFRIVNNNYKNNSNHIAEIHIFRNTVMEIHIFKDSYLSLGQISQRTGPTVFQ